MGLKTLDVALKIGGSFGGSSMVTYVFSRSKPAGKREGIEFVNESPATFISKLRERRGISLKYARIRTKPRRKS